MSDPFSARTNFLADEWYIDERDQTIQKSNGDPHEFDPRDAILDSDRILERQLVNVFILERSRARHLGRGQFSTTLDRISDEITWNFRREIKKDILREDEYSGAFKQFEATVQASIPEAFGEKLTEEISGLLGYKVSLKPLLYDSPYGSTHIAKHVDGSLRHVPTDLIGSGHEMMVAIALQIYLAEHLGAPLLIMIDEPEMHLHPRLQEKLGKLLSEKSRTHQIIITSHSPYLVREIGAESNIVRFGFQNGRTEVTPASGLDGKLPWGLSMNEVNYLAFRYTSFGYFNELWAAAMIKFKKESVMDLDQELEAAGLHRTEKWQRSSGNQSSVTLPTLVRNTIHHPENKNNRQILEGDVELAIKELRCVL